MMTDRRPVLRRADPDLDPAVAAPADDCPAEPLCPHQRLLPHPHQPVPGRSGPAVQLLAEGFRQRDPGRRRSASRRLLVSAHGRLRAARNDRHRRGHHRILCRVEFRAAMAPLDDRVLHLALAPSLDALQARAQHRQHRQPRSADIPGRRQLHQRQRHRLELRQRGHLQLYDSGDLLGDQPCVVLDHSLGHIERA